MTNDVLMTNFANMETQTFAIIFGIGLFVVLVSYGINKSKQKK